MDHDRNYLETRAHKRLFFKSEDKYRETLYPLALPLGPFSGLFRGIEYRDKEGSILPQSVPQGSHVSVSRTIGQPGLFVDRQLTNVHAFA